MILNFPLIFVCTNGPKIHCCYYFYSQAGLIKMGAKFAPCMRSDRKLEEALAEERRNESTTGCCVKSDGSGCIQTTQKECSVSAVNQREKL